MFVSVHRIVGMDTLSKEQRADLLEWYVLSGKSVTQTRRKAFAQWGVRISNTQLIRLYEQFRNNCFKRNISLGDNKPDDQRLSLPTKLNAKWFVLCLVHPENLSDVEVLHSTLQEVR